MSGKFTKSDGSHDIALSDCNGKSIVFSSEHLDFIGTWPDGQINFFFVDNTPTILEKFLPHEISEILDDIQNQMQAAGRAAPILTQKADAVRDGEYRFLFNAAHIQSFSFEKARIDSFNAAAQNLAEADIPIYLCIDGQAFGLPFTPDQEEMKNFLSALKIDDKNWVTMTPESSPPFNITAGEFHIRKDAIIHISGYLLGNAIFDLSKGGRLFVPIAENMNRTQHIKIAQNISILKPLGDEKSRVYINPEFFDPADIQIEWLDLGSDIKNALLMYREDWHLPFPTIEEAVKTLEDFVRRYKNDPYYTYNFAPSAGVDDTLEFE